MPEHTISPRTYAAVCAALVVLTLLTVGVSFFAVGGFWHIALGLTIAAGKATLVVLFFMHVLVNRRLTAAVVIVSCFWLTVLLVLTLGDYMTRGLVPFTPGH